MKNVANIWIIHISRNTFTVIGQHFTEQSQFAQYFVWFWLFWTSSWAAVQNTVNIGKTSIQVNNWIENTIFDRFLHFQKCISTWNTGNRWMVTLWTATPHKQPPLDLTELENVGPFHLISVRLSIEQKYLSLFKDFCF